jgi:hypothetical protein
MNAAVSIVVPFLGLLTFAPAHPSAGRTSASQTVADKAQEGAGKTKDTVVTGAKIAADATNDRLSKGGEVMTDEWITARIHERFVGEDC